MKSFVLPLTLAATISSVWASPMAMQKHGFIGCSAEQKSTLQSVLKSATDVAAKAAEEVRKNPQEFQEIFDTSSQEAIDATALRYEGMADMAPWVEFDCGATCHKEGIIRILGTLVEPCPDFWKLKALDCNYHDQTMVMFHELTHISSPVAPETEDYALSPADFAYLSPEQSLNDALSHELFAKAVAHPKQCDMYTDFGF